MKGLGLPSSVLKIEAKGPKVLAKLEILLSCRFQ
jgi:hypothetical protein